ncbi:MAG: DOMON-like domain-containing protein [Azoarcus sp.]|nr:DOMON-like domain-containing protein [Azoarcus sp.]MDD2874818.1 DOMON-like domain-containing protein [Azoarcus sp.]MDX9837878.1 DOMON-like domain-containing protein [Azoarcus sp.]
MTSKSSSPARIPTITVGLRPFPGTPATASNADDNTVPPVRALLATMHALPDGGARFVFELDADPARVRIPVPTESGPADDLWQHTCFEVFVAAPGDDAYREFNLSPSRQWANYAFTAYRERDDAFSPPAAPRIQYTARADGLTLEAELPAASLPTITSGTDLRIALAAVIELDTGELEYWALKHPAAKPDFHDRDGFVLTLNMAAPEAA